MNLRVKKNTVRLVLASGRKVKIENMSKRNEWTPKEFDCFKITLPNGETINVALSPAGERTWRSNYVNDFHTEVIVAAPDGRQVEVNLLSEGLMNVVLNPQDSTYFYCGGELVRNDPAGAAYSNHESGPRGELIPVESYNTWRREDLVGSHSINTQDEDDEGEDQYRDQYQEERKPFWYLKAKLADEPVIAPPCEPRPPSKRRATEVSEAEKQEMRSLFATGRYSYWVLAQKFNINQIDIPRIVLSKEENQ